MKTITLTRMHDDGTSLLGALQVPGVRPLATLERPWLANARNISCFPHGVYTFRKWHSPTFDRTVLRMDDGQADEIGRSDLLIHPANFPRQLQGCIAPGLQWTDWPSEDAWGVSNSRDALDAILAGMGDADEVTLTILQPVLTMADARYSPHG